MRSQRTPSRTIQRIRADLVCLIEQNELSIVFQPILSLQTGEVVGYEALTRAPADSPFANTGELFQAAGEADMLEELEQATRLLTFRAVSRHWVDGARLFLNVSPSVFLRDGFRNELCCELERESRLDPRQVVVEITERADDDVIADLHSRMQPFRELGFQIAIDDVGAGNSGLNRISQARPDWLKLDRELISNIDDDPFKQNLIRFFVRFATLSNMDLIAEGIESSQELATLIELGVSHAQGFHLAPPGRLDQPIPAEIHDRIVELSRDAAAARFHDITTVRIGGLVVPTVTCDQFGTVDEACDLLATSPRSAGVVVLDGLRYLGWIGRDRLEAIAAETRGRIPLSAARLEDCEQLGEDVTLAEALHIVGSRPDERLALPVVVEADGRVAGIVTPRQLLLAAAEAHRHATAHIAPLTGLPSRVQADRWLADRIGSGDPAHIAFVDLRDFDAYNRAYGFEMGDLMLRRVVVAIQTQLADIDDEAKFVAHIGEDRFLLALPDEAGDRLQDLIDSFEQLRREFFSAADQQQGSFSYVDAKGQTRSLPLTTLRVVYLRNVLQRVGGPHEVYELAVQLRMRSPDKATRAGTVVTDRRADEVAQWAIG